MLRPGCQIVMVPVQLAPVQSMVFEDRVWTPLVLVSFDSVRLFKPGGCGSISGHAIREYARGDHGSSMWRRPSRWLFFVGPGLSLQE